MFFMILGLRGAMTWKGEILVIIKNHWKPGEQFTLRELYDFKESLEGLHPGNHDVEAKIRQVLQTLRSERILEFVDDRGSYRLRCR